MDLFAPKKAPINLLAKEGIVHYYGILLAEPLADQYLTYLMEPIAWRNNQA